MTRVVQYCWQVLVLGLVLGCRVRWLLKHHSEAGWQDSGAGWQGSRAGWQGRGQAGRAVRQAGRAVGQAGADRVNSAGDMASVRFSAFLCVFHLLGAATRDTSYGN